MPNVIQTEPVPRCPECYGPMVLRRPKTPGTWDVFWGCQDYPQCKGTRHINFADGTPESDDPDLDAFGVF